MSSELVTDDRGRVTLPPDMRERHGKRYIAIDMPDGIHLYPVPKGPLKWGGKPLSPAEQKRQILEDTEKEVLDELRSIHGVRLGRKR